MKHLLKHLLITVALGGLSSLSATAQCTADACAAKITSGFTFLKSYQMPVTANTKEVEYSYVFTKGTSYELIICNQDGTSKGVEVTVYDSQRKKLVSNFDKENNKYYGTLIYDCQTTGIVYMKYTYVTKPTCCGAVLAFKRLP